MSEGEAPGLSEQYTRASPWPVFVALGIPLSELGILFGSVPVAVGGLLLFGGSVAGMAAESGYAATPWRALAYTAVVCFLLGGWFRFGGLGLPVRGEAILAAGVLLLLGGLVGSLAADDARPV